MHGLPGLGHLEDGSGQTGLLGAAALRGDSRSFGSPTERGSDGGADGVTARRCTPGLVPPTGVEGREEEPWGTTGSGSWVGFLRGEGATCRFLLAAAAAPFLSSVGVQEGDAE